MNFSKYAAALALFATAAYATTEDKKEATDIVKPKPVDITSENLVAAFKKCNSEEKEGTKKNDCFTGEKVPAEVIAKLKDLKDLDKEAAQAIIDAVNKELTAKDEGHWYDSINNVYGYVGGVVLLAAIGGGIYMAVGRKSEEADL